MEEFDVNKIKTRPGLVKKRPLPKDSYGKPPRRKRGLKKRVVSWIVALLRRVAEKELKEEGVL